MRTARFDLIDLGNLVYRVEGFEILDLVALPSGLERIDVVRTFDILESNEVPAGHAESAWVYAVDDTCRLRVLVVINPSAQAVAV